MEAKEKMKLIKKDFRCECISFTHKEKVFHIFWKHFQSIEMQMEKWESKITYYLGHFQLFQIVENKMDEQKQ